MIGNVSKPTSHQSYTALATNVREWFLEEKAQDITFKSTPTLYWMWRAAQMRELPAINAVRLLDAEGAGGDAFTHYDTVSTANSKGPTAGYLPTVMYSWPIPLSLQEEREHTSPEAMADLVEQKVFQQERTAGKRLSIDLFAGSVSNSKRLTGLEQILFPRTQYDDASAVGSYVAETTLVYTPDVWRLRSATNASNVYAGITRTDYTDDGVGGTGWEGVGINYFGASANILKYSSSAPYGPDLGMQALTMGFNAATYGMDRPKILVSTNAPYDHYEFAAQAKSTIYKVASEFSGVELAYSALSYKGVPWIRDEYAKTWNTSLGNANSSYLNNIYGLNTDTLRLVIDPRDNMRLTDERVAYSQHASVMFMVLRAVLMCTNPRMNFRAFNYPNN